MKMPAFQRIMLRLPFGIQIIHRLPPALLPKRVRALIHDHMTTLNLREGIQRTMFFDLYEATETEWFRQCVGTGDVVVDLGANFGHYTSLGASLVGATGRVYAFEPSPVAAASIEEMIRHSTVDNIVLVKAAVGGEKGTAALQIPTTSHLHTPSILASDPAFLPLKIDVIALDDFARENRIDRIKLLKIDVEGYEPDVLAGARELLRRRAIDNIFCEFNSGWLELNHSSPTRLLNTVLDAGYAIHRQTQLLEGLPSHGGKSTFSLQDIWFRPA